MSNPVCMMLVGHTMQSHLRAQNINGDSIEYANRDNPKHGTR